jgi:hypothetical protein
LPCPGKWVILALEIMNNLSSRIWVSSLGAALAVSVLPGCTTYVYDSPPPAQPPVVYVPNPPPDNPPPPPEPVEAPPPDYTPPPPAPVVVIAIQAESDFYEPLGHYGRWVNVNDYGRCWVPDEVDHDWRPYTRGCWQRTDNGWYWSSDEPWGWATCHYGRWFYDPSLGWAWVPQTQWAPAWVAWRDGDDYTGWAPLPPRARLRADGGLERPDEDVDPHSFVFVEHRRMLERQQPQTVIINNITVIQKTVNITKITVVNKTVINEGPRPEVIAKAAGHTVDIVPARTLRTQHEAPAIAKDHLRTKVVQPRNTPPAAANPPEARGNEERNPRPVEPVQPQHVATPEHSTRPPEPAQPMVVPNQPRPPQPQVQPQPQPAPHQNFPESKRNELYFLTNRPTQHQPMESKPVNPPHLNRVETEPARPVQPANPPEPRPEVHPPQTHAVPNEPRPEQNPPPRPAVQHENEGNQPAHPPQPKPEPNQPKKGAPHPEEDKNHHSSTNAPPHRD